MSDCSGGMPRCLLLLLTLLFPSVARAHEIGTTQVRLVLHRDHTWSASITTAPTALVNRLEALAGLPPSRNLTPDRVREKLTHFAAALGGHIDVAFDGVSSAANVSLGEIEMPADIRLPAFVTFIAAGTFGVDAEVVSWRYDLVYSTYAVVFSVDTGGNAETQWLDADATSRPFPVAGVRPSSFLEIIRQYLQLGFLHIVPQGLDHILFVLGIFLLTTRLRPILVQVTAFTIAHSVTLGLTMYGVIALAPRVVEPLIALSVAYVAIENIFTSNLTPWRPVVVFCFGLLHGMGFAGVLAELRLPHAEIIPALISFNVGIEFAQLTVITTAFLAVAFWLREKPWYRSRFVIPASTVIAAIGLFWTVQRTIQA